MWTDFLLKLQFCIFLTSFNLATYRFYMVCICALLPFTSCLHFSEISLILCYLGCRRKTQIRQKACDQSNIAISYHIANQIKEKWRQSRQDFWSRFLNLTTDRQLTSARRGSRPRSTTKMLCRSHEASRFLNWLLHLGLD